MPTAPQSHRRSGRLVVAIIVLVVGSSIGFAVARSFRSSPGSGHEARPNIVLILTDDQRWDELGHMPIVKREIGDHGVTFSNGYVVNPLCCPSRTTILTGQYSHSTDIYWNRPPHGGFQTFTRLHEDRSTIATWLQSAGYTTALIGKYLNGYQLRDASYVPPGWNHWEALAPNLFGRRSEDEKGGYFNYYLSMQGKQVFYGHSPQDYSTDVFARDAATFIHSVPASKPLFLYLALRPPHVPTTPPPRYRHACAGLPPLRPPSYNEADVSDKPAYIRTLPLMDRRTRASVDRDHLDHCRTLLAADDAVGKVVSALSATGRLSNTLLMFTSDQGLEEGEHRWPSKKAVPYEESIRTPILIRYDPLTRGMAHTDNHLVLNLDFASTFAAAAGVSAPKAAGRSLLPLLTNSQTPWRHDFLIEHWAAPSTPWYVPPYCAVHTSRYVYVEYTTGERELYDLKKDPYELTNMASFPAEANLVRRLRARLLILCSPPPPGMTP